MGQHADDAIAETLTEEEYRAEELTDNEPVNRLFEHNIPTLENIDNELARLMNYF